MAALMEQSPANSLNPVLNRSVIEFGRKIFADIDRAKPSLLNKNYWTNQIMHWSMARPDFKLNMFRLVDVLPTLRTSAAVASHVTEYLGPLADSFGALARWGVTINPRSLRAKMTALAVRKGVEQMASQFIAGYQPSEALKALKKLRKRQIAFTCDLLGEFSLSEQESLAYLDRYLKALTEFGQEIHSWPESTAIIDRHPGELSPVCISVKLTALYSQCSMLNFERSVQVLSERLAIIVRKAREVNALVYVDAEDVSSNEMIYESFRRVFSSDEFIDFPYPGIVLQAYAKESGRILGELLEFARRRAAPIAIRLVKGAYWDHETILSQQNGWPSPLFSRKESSDANYEALSRILIDNHNLVLPAFASHNVRSLSHACVYARERGLSPKDFELQMLFGMADPIAESFVSQGYLVRQYVPMGDTLPGMGYLIRRLLENTSNESFLRHTFFEKGQVDSLLREPLITE